MITKDRVIRFILIFLIASSLVLTYLIWMSPIKPPEKEVSNAGTTTAVQSNLKSATEAFLPNKAIWYQGTARSASTKESFISLIQTELINGKYGALTAVTDDDAYTAALGTTAGVELEYVGKFSLEEFLNVYNLKFPLGDEKSAAVTFDRIVLDFKENYLYLLNDSRPQTIYRAALEIAEGDISAYVTKNKKDFIGVSRGHETLPNFYYVDESISLPKYNYILATQPYTTFTSAFFSETSDLTINDNGQELIYSNSVGESLSIADVTGQVFYRSASNQNSNDNSYDRLVNNLYRQSFDALAPLGNQLGNLRYFDLNNNSLTFTTYLEGYPLMSPNFQGQVQVEFNGEHLSRIYSNVESVQIPIPADEQVLLPDTATFLATLGTAGVDLSKIENLQIGYQWQNLKEVSQVIVLIPQWFIRYAGEWYTQTELLTVLEVNS